MAGVMETWRAGHDYNFCKLRTREDFILTGRNPNTGGKNVFGKQYTEFAVSDSEYADDTAIPFCNRADAEKYTPLLIEHFRRWGLEVHAGSYHPFKGSKTELLFCSRPLSTYQDPNTCDNTDMTDLILPNGRFVPVVTKFKYLGSYISSDGSDTNRCPISDRFCSSCLWIIIQMHISITKY